MKQMIYGIVLTAVVGMYLAMVLTVHGRSSRQNEITQSVDHAMKAAMEQYQNGGREAGMGKDEFIAGFLEHLLVNCNSQSEVTVNVLQLDLEMGLFSVEVIESYLHPGGQRGTVSTFRTMVVDRKLQEEEMPACNICLYLSKEDLQAEDGSYKNCYKVFTAAKGSVFALPQELSMKSLESLNGFNGKTLKEWCTMNGSVITNPFEVTGNISAYAVFE